ncbi:hypothetical protein Plec18167_000138 [Paecilomyces lecythidis]|uniref:Uncharacterized protein n=1 Tax=Paecilomyces lecythidis TaxID=3004212 RepID=A0ABR3YD19_9EURO
MTNEITRQIGIVLNNFNAIEDLTYEEELWKRFMNFHWQARRPIVLNKFDVSQEQFEEWREQLDRCGKEHAEYDPKAGKIIFKADHCPVKRILRAVMNQWISELERRLRTSTGNDFMFNPTDGFRLSGPYEGHVQTTFVHLRRGDQAYPTLVVEIAFTEPTETLFQRAKMWLEGTKDTTQLVILIDIKERRAPSKNSKHVKQEDKMWGVTDEEIALRLHAFWPMYHHIMYWYYENKLPLTGRFTVNMYVWGSHMAEPDKIWECDFPSDRTKPAVEHRENAVGSESEFCFYGIKTLFPIEQLKRETWKAMRFWSYERAANFAVEKLKELGLPITGYVRG